MKIGGLNSFSLSDYPGHIAAVVFTQGCNFRCRFCHNGLLFSPDVPIEWLIPEEDALEFLERRRKQLDAVVISGGEPTIQPDLSAFLHKIKAMGLLVKLDTNGSHPEVLRRLLKQSLLDYIAMDIKAPLNRYYEITRACSAEVERIPESIALIASSSIVHEFRTTVVEALLSPKDMEGIRKLVPVGSLYCLQEFRPEHAFDLALRNHKNR